MTAELVTTHRSFCRSCSAMCGTLVETDGDRVVRVRGDAAHEFSQGYMCGNGRAVAESHHSPRRLERPQMRVDGALVDTTWDECLDHLAGQLRQIIDESGPQAVGVFRGSGGYLDAGGYLVSAAIPAVLGTPSMYSDMTVDVISKPFVSELIAGVPGQMAQPDFGRCPLIVYVGSNPVVSHGHTSTFANPIARLREMTARGEVWVVDPRRTETAGLATGHLAPRPGTDYAVFAFLVRELLRAGADHDYLRDHAQDVDRLTAAVERFDQERAADLTGLTVEELQGFLAAVRRAGTLAVETGTGVSMSAAANVTQWMTWAVMIVTASLDRPGGAWVNPGFLMQFDQLELPISPPGGMRGPGPASRSELRSVLGEYPCVAMPDEIESGNLRGLINIGGNLVTCLPDTDRVVTALGKIEVLASLEIMATETTALSTHLLPTKDQLERADLPYLLDHAFPTIATQYTPASVTPVGERRSMWWVLVELGRRMGYDFLPGIDPAVATDDDVLAHIAANARTSFEELRSGDLVQAEDVPLGWLERHVDRMGGWRVAPVELVEQLATLAPPPPLVLISRRSAKHINSRNRHRSAPPEILVNEADARSAGVGEGESARVRSAYGVLSGIVRVDSTLRRGALSIADGWSDSHNVNRLTSAEHDVEPLTGMPRFSGLAVTLEPAVDGSDTTD